MMFAIFRGGAEDASPSNQRYASLNDASEALRITLGWPDILLAPGYSADGGQEWRAYRDESALKAGADDAPYIRREGVAAPLLEP